MTKHLKKILSVNVESKLDFSDLVNSANTFINSLVPFLKITQTPSSKNWIIQPKNALHLCIDHMKNLKIIEKATQINWKHKINESNNKLFLPLTEQTQKTMKQLALSGIKYGKKLYIYHKTAEADIVFNLSSTLYTQLKRDSNLTANELKKIINNELEILYFRALCSRQNNDNENSKKLLRQIIKKADENFSEKANLLKTQSHFQLYQTIITEQLEVSEKNGINHLADDRKACRIMKFLIESSQKESFLIENSAGKLMALFWLNHYYEKNSIENTSDFWNKFPYAINFTKKVDQTTKKQPNDLKLDHDVFLEMFLLKFHSNQKRVLPFSKNETKRLIDEVLIELQLDQKLSTICQEIASKHNFPIQNESFYHSLMTTEHIDLSTNKIEVNGKKRRSSIIAIVPKNQKIKKAEQEKETIGDICSELNLKATSDEIEDDVELAKATFSELEDQTLIASILSRLLFSVDNDVDTGNTEQYQIKQQLTDIIQALTKGEYIHNNPQAKLAHFFNSQLIQIEESPAYWQPFFDSFSETFKSAIIQKTIKPLLEKGNNEALNKAKLIRPQTSGVDLCLKLGALLISKKEQHHLNHKIFEFEPIKKLFELVNKLVSLFNELDSATKELSEGDTFNEVYIRLREILNEKQLYLNKDIFSSDKKLILTKKEFKYVDKCINGIKNDCNKIFFQIQQHLILLSIITENDLAMYNFTKNDLDSCIKISVGWLRANAWSVENNRYHDLDQLQSINPIQKTLEEVKI